MEYRLLVRRQTVRPEVYELHYVLHKQLLHYSTVSRILSISLSYYNLGSTYIGLTILSFYSVKVSGLCNIPSIFLLSIIIIIIHPLIMLTFS